MNKKEVISKIAEKMRNEQMRKPIHIPKQTLHISDDEGNSKDFTVKKTDKAVLFTVDDVEMFLDAFVMVCADAMHRGEIVSIPGFGKIGLKYRRSRAIKSVSTGEDAIAKGHYVPTISFGKEMKISARTYEEIVDNTMAEMKALLFDIDDAGNDTGGGV